MNCTNCKRPLSFPQVPGEKADILRFLSAACYCHVPLSILELVQGGYDLDALADCNKIRRCNLEEAGFNEEHIRGALRWTQYPLPEGQMRQIEWAIAWHDRQDFDADEDEEIQLPESVTKAYPTPPKAQPEDHYRLELALNEIPQISDKHRQFMGALLVAGGFQHAMKAVRAWKESVR